jgi:hypothetical protein
MLIDRYNGNILLLFKFTRMHLGELLQIDLEVQSDDQLFFNQTPSIHSVNLLHYINRLQPAISF